MTDLSNIAIIGSGPTALYFIQNIWNHIDVLKDHLNTITIFEKAEVSGMGMPYSPRNTDIYNLANISSEEIPLLQETFANWLRKQSKDKLEKLNVANKAIDDAEVYSRVALGYYFQEQFKQLLDLFKSIGINIQENCEHEVIDISAKKTNEIIITDIKNKKYTFSTVVIANGHEWKEDDIVNCGYYGSPWPIRKILPKENEFYNFPIGTLGASLSAFDVVTSLSHRHGKFLHEKNSLKFVKNKEASNFKMVLHSAEGWLPHLQYEQQEPIREIYRHFDRTQLLNLIDHDGFLRISDFFDNLCRPALISAFTNDKLLDVVIKLKDPSFTFKDFVAIMSDRHEYINSFEGMKSEMIIAKNSVNNNIPIYWMETLDDLMYSLNYHAELLPAEDHLFFHKEVMAFLMNVIAALPLQSAEILLALYDANAIELKTGLVKFPEDSFENNRTKINLESENGTSEELEYKLFINCSGQKKLELDDFPFPSLVEDGTVRTAKAKFANQNKREKPLSEIDENNIIYYDGDTYLKLSGIDINSSYRIIDTSGKCNDGIFDINFTHTNGLRPYSYGLQACNATSLILVESLIAEIIEGKKVGNDIENITELYEDNDAL